MKTELVYLASPYTHPDPAVRERRHDIACRVAGRLMLKGRRVFSPIAHSHVIGLAIEKPTDRDFWLAQDSAILEHASELVVLMLPGWRESYGVSQEIKRATELGIPVSYNHPEDFGVHA